MLKSVCCGWDADSDWLLEFRANYVRLDYQTNRRGSSQSPKNPGCLSCIQPVDGGRCTWTVRYGNFEKRLKASTAPSSNLVCVARLDSRVVRSKVSSAHLLLEALLSFLKCNKLVLSEDRKVDNCVLNTRQPCKSLLRQLEGGQNLVVGELEYRGQ